MVTGSASVILVYRPLKLNSMERNLEVHFQRSCLYLALSLLRPCLILAGVTIWDSHSLGHSHRHRHCVYLYDEFV
jgi:hypothetical protein